VARVFSGEIQALRSYDIDACGCRDPLEDVVMATLSIF
jgi:hypothetical protein